MSSELPIIVSFLSLAIAATALGWNIYRDVVLKPRIKCSVAIIGIVQGKEELGRHISVRATNHGPGSVELISVEGRIAPLWRRALRRSEYYVVIPDFANPASTRLPKRLQVGEVANLLFPLTEDAFLSQPFTHIGVMDSFGRTHSASRGNIKSTKEQFLKEFPKRPTQTDEG